MDTSQDHFDADDQALLEALRQDDADGAGEGERADETQQAARDSVVSEQGAADAKTDAVDAAATEIQQEQQGQPQGDLRQALRAARRAERRALDEVRRTKEELAAFKAAGGAATNADAELDEALAQDFPAVAQALKKRDQEIAALTERLSQSNQAREAPEAVDFAPPSLPPEVQEVVDDIPDLLALQHNPDQAGWQLAIGFDVALQNHPTWRDKTPTERFAEAARRAKAEIAPTQATTRTEPPDPEAVIKAALDKAPRRQPTSLSDFGGGAATEPEGSQLQRYAKMSDEDILTDLLRGG